MIITIKYFGAIADVTEQPEEQIYFQSENNSVKSFRSQLEILYPGIQNIAYSIALNQSMAKDTDQIKDNDELALLPPFAGG